MNSILKNIKGYTKIYSSSVDEFKPSTFHEKCTNHVYTITIARSNFGKILGGFSPMKWQNYNCWIEITGGESFVFFFDEDKLRICT